MEGEEKKIIMGLLLVRFPRPDEAPESSRAACKEPPFPEGRFPLYVEHVTTRAGPRWRPHNWGGVPVAEDVDPADLEEVSTRAWCVLPDGTVDVSWNGENGPQGIHSIYWLR
jgi:hypothetical protein